MKPICLLSFVLFVAFSSFSQTVNVSASDLKVMDNGLIYDAAIQPDGKIIIVGDFTSFNGVAVRCIARIKPDGALDETFNTGSGPDNGIFVTYITDIKLLADGKILIRGAFSKFNGVQSYRLARLQANGSFDTSFVPATNTTDQSGTYRHPVAGDASSVYYSYYSSTDSKHYIGRLNSDGTVNSSFSANAFGGKIMDMDIQPDGKLLVGGHFTSYNGQAVSGAIRLNPDGSLHKDFAVSVGNVNRVDYATSVDKISLSGDTGVRILNPDGSVDANFSISSVSRTSDATWISSTEFVVGDGNGRVRKISSTTNAVSYTPPNATSGDIVGRVLLQSNGKIIVVNTHDSPEKVIYRLNSDFTPDNTFNVGTGANIRGSLHAAAHTNGKLILAGQFSYIKGIQKKGIVRLNGDFSVDNTFNTGSGFGPGTNNLTHSIKVQPDGKILIMGEAKSYNGTAISGFVRLQSDGTLDNTFTAGPIEFSPYVQNGTGNGAESTVHVLADGGMFLGGHFSKFGGSTSKKYLVKLSPTGVIDDSFTHPIDGPITGMAMQPDGKLVIGYVSIQTTPHTCKFLRLNANGTVDATFTPALNLTSATARILRVYVLPSGKILLGGTNIGVNGAKNNCVRLLANGSVDPSFSTPDAASSNSAPGPYLMKDGTLILVAAGQVKRVNVDGVADVSFTPLTIDYNVGGQLRDVVHMDPSNMVFIGTYLNKINSTTIDNFAVASYTLFPAVPGAPSNLQLSSAGNGYPTLTWTDNASSEESFELERKDAADNSFSNVFNPSANATSYQDISAKDHKTYIYRIRAKNKAGSSEFSNEVTVATLITGLEEVATTWTVSPNPAKESITIRKNSASEIENQIVILDVLGRACIRHSSSQSETKISIESLATGIYFVKMSDANNLVVRLVKN